MAENQLRGPEVFGFFVDPGGDSSPEVMHPQAWIELQDFLKLPPPGVEHGFGESPFLAEEQLAERDFWIADIRRAAEHLREAPGERHAAGFPALLPEVDCCVGLVEMLRRDSASLAASEAAVGA